MKRYVEEIKSMTQSGVKIDKIVEWTGLNISEIRQIMLENSIFPCEKDREYRYFKDAQILKMHVNDAYFYTDLSKITGISLSRVRFLAEIYNIKPCKKAFCMVCGEEIDLSKSKIVNKYCSKKCSDKQHRPKKERKPIVKRCIYCAKTFEGKPNSKYCCDFCKQLSNAVEGTVKWLRG